MPDARLDHLGANVAHWSVRADDQLAVARRQWAAAPNWGGFGVPEEELGLLPAPAERLRVAELGCGTGYVSAWLARRGAHVVGIDPTPGQLAIARRCQQEIGPTFPLVRAVGEQVPLAGGSFDLVISEYGAAVWADPHRWIPEAARLLRAGGELVFLGNSTLSMLCTSEEGDGPAGDRLVRDHFGLHRFEWPDDGTVEFHLGHGDWIRLLRTCGFEVEDLVELRPPPGATAAPPYLTLEWARRWPGEELWRARRR